MSILIVLIIGTGTTMMYKFGSMEDCILGMDLLEGKYLLLYEGVSWIWADGRLSRREHRGLGIMTTSDQQVCGHL